MRYKAPCGKLRHSKKISEEAAKINNRQRGQAASNYESIVMSGKLIPLDRQESGTIACANLRKFCNRKRAMNHLNKRIENQVEKYSRLCVVPSEKYARNVGEIDVARRSADNKTHDAEIDFSAPREKHSTPFKVSFDQHQYCPSDSRIDLQLNSDHVDARFEDFDNKLTCTFNIPDGTSDVARPGKTSIDIDHYNDLKKRLEAAKKLNTYLASSGNL